MAPSLEGTLGSQETCCLPRRMSTGVLGAAAREGAAPGGSAQLLSFCLAVVVPGPPFPGLPDCPLPRASFLPHMDPRQSSPSKWGRGRFSLWSCDIRSSGCSSFGRYQDMTSEAWALSPGQRALTVAWPSPQLPGDTSLDVLTRARAPSPPWSPVKVPSLHDTDMWGVLLFQARPQPTGWATPIAVAITGREAGGQLLL